MECRICGNKKNNQTYQAREMMFGTREVFEYFQCSQCGCLQIKEYPSDMSRYYPRDYYSYSGTGIIHSCLIKKFLIGLRNNYIATGRGLIGKLLNKKFPDQTLEFVIKLIAGHDRNVLDLGSGSGNMLYSLRELGFSKLLGADPFIENTIAYENGLKIIKSSIFEIGGTWDLITFLHSFEHLPFQVKTLQFVEKILSPEGICMISIPTVSSYAWNRYGVNWSQLDAPRHYYLHSLESMKTLAQKSGLEVYEVHYNSTAIQFWGSEQYLKDIPLHDKRSCLSGLKNSLFKRREIKKYIARSEELNKNQQGDQAIFLLRKAASPLPSGR